MDHSDDDIVVVDEIKVNNIQNKWKYKAPNPILRQGELQKIFENVQKKLQMENPPTSSGVNTSSVETAASSSGGKNKRNGKNKATKFTEKLDMSLVQSSHTELQKTPQKTMELGPVSTLSPEEIQELTENCLDSDNEPEVTPIKSSLKNPHYREIETSRPKRMLSFSVKASNSVRNKASKFFGAGTSREDVDKILSQGNEIDVRSPSKSPSPKKKRLSKNSPIRFLPSHMRLQKSPGKKRPIVVSPGKLSLGRVFSGTFSPSKGSLGQEAVSVSKLDNNLESQIMSDGPYYYEAFCYMVKEVCNNPELKHLFLKTELKTIEMIDDARKEFQLYVRLMNRKDKWNRCSDISYNDICLDLSHCYDYLEEHGFLSCDLSDEKLDVLLHLLKMEELKKICQEFKVKKNGKKSDLVESLLSMHRTQPTLGGSTSPLHRSVLKTLGRCVRLTVEWRIVFRRCILLFSMFHSHEDLDKLNSEQGLLLLQLKLGKMLFPLNGCNIKPNYRIFYNRDQLIRFEESKELSQEINIAMDMQNYQGAEELTKKCMKLFSTLLELDDETKHVLQLPSFLRKFSAGSIYAHALTRSIDALKRKQNYSLALNVLELLMKQKIYSLHRQGQWAFMQSKLLHVNLKNIVRASQVLCAVLKNKSQLSPRDRMQLQERAELVYKLKKNGLSWEQKHELGSVMDPPSEAPDAVEISACAISSSKPGLKKVYVRDTDDGKEYMSVEETVIAHYKNLGFSCGLHDEGSTISSLCLLSLWNQIYDISVPSVFQSRFQHKPLDWGSKEFYESRKDAVEAHFSDLEHQDVKSVADSLCELRAKHGLTTSVVNWDRLANLDIFAFLQCISIPVFVAVARRLVQDWKSHKSGFPDLIIWSPPQKKCLFIEVKSPNDTLSTVQCLWLDFLKKCNAKAIVANIRESGSKKVRTFKN